MNYWLRRLSALAILMLAGLAMGWLINANRAEQHSIQRLLRELQSVSADNDALRRQIRDLGAEPVTPTVKLPDAPATTTTTVSVVTGGKSSTPGTARPATTAKGVPVPPTTQFVAPSSTTTSTATPPATVPTTTTTRCQVNVVGICIGRG